MIVQRSKMGLLQMFMTYVVFFLNQNNFFIRYILLLPPPDYIFIYDVWTYILYCSYFFNLDVLY